MKMTRLFVCALLLAFIWIFLFVTVFTMQVVETEEYQLMAKSNAVRSETIGGERGKIMDRNGKVLADMYTKTTFETTVRERKDRKGRAIRDSVTGVAVLDTVVKMHKSREGVFPMGSVASQIIGKLGKDGKGSFGIEKTFDEKLRGRVGFRRKIQNNNGKEVFGLGEVMAESDAGLNLVLTVDASIQESVEKILKEGVDEFEAKSASAVVIDPYTGDILAAATYPTFDPNAKSSGVGAQTKCGVFTLPYEPGSTFKVVTALAALEENTVTVDQIFDDEHGAWKLPSGDVIREHDGKDLGNMNMAEALAKSSNIVYGKIAESVGKENFYRFIRNFGFGSRTSKELPGEEPGRITKPHETRWSGRTLQTMGFGHELLVTPIQMAMAFAAVANGGNLMEPRIVREWRDEKGNVVEKTEPTKLRRMVSEATAASLREMLRGVVASGTAMRVNSKALPELEFGGKTGTAEKYSQEKKGYDRHRQIASFIGLAPAADPKYVCLVLLDEPMKHGVGGASAGPMFRKIMEDIYFNPNTSPRAFRMSAGEEVRRCEKNWNGMSIERAKEWAELRACALNIVGEGDVVIASVRETADSVTLMLGTDQIVEMPDLKGLSLKEALKVLGDAHLQVEFSGKGRVAVQEPKPATQLERGQICKLVLKEKV